MPQLMSSRRRRSRAAAGILLVALASMALAACGGSSNSSSSSATTSASATTTPTKTAPGALGTAGAGRFLALRECLKKNGVTLPQRKPGAGGFLGGPQGANKANYEAALKKCGRGFVPGRGRFGSTLNTPQAKQALAKFASCLRENGVNVPAPNTSGKGAVFGTKGINTRSSAFKAAESKCRTDLRGAFGATPGAARPGG
jgi:hypothetical protein